MKWILGQIIINYLQLLDQKVLLYVFKILKKKNASMCVCDIVDPDGKKANVLV